MQRSDDDVGPESAAVLTDPPPLVLKKPLSLSDRQLALGLSGRYVLDGIEAGEMLADNLRSPISLEALRSRIPRCYAAIAIQHENREVSQPLDLKAEAFLSFAKLS